MQIIDAHQHFWSLARGDYGWLTPALEPLYRDFQPQDLAPLLEELNVEGTVLVQAAPTEAETHYLLQLAAENPFIKGVVGWVDFESPEAAERIAALAQNPKLVGLRPMIQDLPDDTWMLQSDLVAAFRALTAHKLAFDALVLPRHLEPLKSLLQQHPDLKVVIDHGAKPEITTGEISTWAKDMAELAQGTQIHVKLSGLVTEASLNWTHEDLQPYVEVLLRHFGPERIIWGSDWPVLTLAAEYPQWLRTSQDLLSHLTTSEQAAIFGSNAKKFYGI